MKTRFPILALLLCVCVPALADDPDYSAGMLDREVALERLKGATPEAFPNSDEVIVSAIQRMHYNADGTYVQWHEEYVKILTEASRRRLSTLSSYYTIPYQRGPEDCSIPLVEVLHADGTVTAIDVETDSRTMINPSSMKENIYNPNEKIIKVNIPGLKIGDTLHFIMYDRVVQPRMADTWSDYFVFEGTRPIMHRIVEITAPAEMPLRSIALKDPIEGTVSDEVIEGDETILYRWTIQNVPRTFSEPNMPSMHTVIQRLLVSTNPDWQTVSRWYWDLSEPHYEASPEMIEKVDELIGEVDDPYEKIRTLFNFVSQEIRYMGIIAESEAPGYEPHDVKDTFSARHGVCRDKAALLVSMMREADLQAYPTLIQNGPKKDEEVPQPYFNHAIVAVRHDGEFLLMDPTDEATRELLPSYLDDRSYLVATPEGESLATSVVEPAENNLLQIRTTGSVDAAGNLTAETQFDFAGINDNVYRGYFSRIKDEERKRLFEGIVRRSTPTASIREVVIEPADMLDTSTNIRATVRYSAGDTLVWGDGIAMLPVPSMGNRAGMVNFIIGKTGLKEREYPLKTGYACGVTEHIRLALDDALETPLLLPQDEPVELETHQWKRAVEQEGTVLEIGSDFRLHATEFSPEEYLELKATLKHIERALRKMPVYSATNQSSDVAESSDVVIENVEVEIDVSSRAEWTERRTVRKKILTYAGKKAHSELKIHFNPAWEIVSLERAVVTSADGEVSEISEGEINVMDAGWVGSAVRYPPEKTMVASFPAVAIGSTVDYTIKRFRRNRPLFTTRETFRGTERVKKKTVSVHVPLSMDLEIHRQRADAIEESIFREADADKATYSWKAEDIGPIDPEDMLPPPWWMHPTVTLSAGSWKFYARALERRLQDAVSGGKQARRRAKELTRDIREPWEQLRAIRDFVEVRVRRVGPNISSLPWTAISDADQTLEDAYGNTTDRAILYYAMLKAIGFDPEFVLAAGRPAIPEYRDSIVPMPDIFGEILVRLRDRSLDLNEGVYIYLGDTDQYAALGASTFDSRWGLSLPDARIEPIAAAKPNRAWMEYAFEVMENGDTTVSIRRMLYGVGFGVENRRYSLMRPEQRDRHFQEMVAKISQSAVATSPLETDFSSYPGRIQYSMEIPEYAVRDGEFLYLVIPSELGSIFTLRSDQRSNPLYIRDRLAVQSRARVKLPDGYDIVARPGDLSRDDLAKTRVDFRVRESASGELVAETEVIRVPSIIDPGDYPSLLDWQRTLQHTRNRLIVLRKKASKN